MMLPDKTKSLWIATTPSTSYPKLDKNLKTDVAIIGGGIAGLNAAYFLQQVGLKVVLVEARQIAMGTSGNTTAKITSQHELKYSYLFKNFGKGKAQMYADANEWAIEILKEIIDKEKIDCDFQRIPAYTYATEKGDISDIHDEVIIAQKLDLPATFVESVESIPFKIYGAIKFEEQAYFHPRKYLLALAKKISSQGGQIFEQTEAKDIEELPNGCEVTTNGGNVQAKFVIVATNFPFYDKDNFFSDMPIVDSFALANKTDIEKPGGMFIGRSQKDLSFRPHVSDRDAWLITGGTHHSYNVGNTEENYENLARIALEIFKVSSVEYKWAAQDSSPIDRLPYIGFYPKSQKILITTGYSAWGMTTSVVSAKLLTDLITDTPNGWKELYSLSRGKPQVVKEEGIMETKEEGKIIVKEGKPVAVYTDEKGISHSVSAICTHMGCTVGWNNKDKTWDCPCHGSRYDKFGKVINGPAPEDLSEVKI